MLLALQSRSQCRRGEPGSLGAHWEMPQALSKALQSRAQSSPWARLAPGWREPVPAGAGLSPQPARGCTLSVTPEPLLGETKAQNIPRSWWQVLGVPGHSAPWALPRGNSQPCSQVINLSPELVCRDALPLQVRNHMAITFCNVNRQMWAESYLDRFIA